MELEPVNAFKTWNNLNCSHNFDQYKRGSFGFLRFFNTVELKREMQCLKYWTSFGRRILLNLKRAHGIEIFKNPDPEIYGALSCTDRIIRWSFTVQGAGADNFKIFVNIILSVH